MYLSEQLQEKWGPVLDHPELPNISDAYKKAVTAVLLENEEMALREVNSQGYGMLTEDSVTNAVGANGMGSASSGPIQGYDPILISLVRRAMPNLVAYDLCGVQPMTGPTGLIFAMRARYSSQAGTEAFYNEATNQSGSGSATGSNPYDALASSTAYTAGGAYSTSAGEVLGSSPAMPQMAFSIDKVTVTANTRALKAEYSMELAQDLKAVHGLDAETELANILSTEILAEINREVIRTVYNTAKAGAAVNTANSGYFDLDVDSNGRWSVEKFKGLLFQVEREANAIAKETRRGKGNIVICSSDVASALQMGGVLDYAPALKTDLNVDDTGNTFVGVLNGRFKVYVDPYAPTSANQYFVVGYKGTSAYDAGLFYCPYVPLQMVRAVGPDSFQPRIGFKTRYGLVANPYAEGTTKGAGALNWNSNVYYRKVGVKNLM